MRSALAAALLAACAPGTALVPHAELDLHTPDGPADVADPHVIRVDERWFL